MTQGRSLALAGLVGLACVSGASVALTDDLPAIEKRGTLRVLAVPGSERFFSVAAEGEPGLDREILESFARVRRLTVTPVAVASWDALIPALVEGRGDVAAGGVTATEARRRQVAFTAEVFPSRLVAVTRRPRPAIDTLERLRAERVGTIRGTSLAEALGPLRLPSLDDGVPPGGLPEALRSGRVTAIVMGVEDAIALQQADPAVQVGLPVGPRASLAFAVRKSDTALHRALDEYVANLRRTPTWNRLVVRYFGESAPEVLKRAQQE
jgi:ABC-type amino acid transport substrate-binding protein